MEISFVFIKRLMLKYNSVASSGGHKKVMYEYIMYVPSSPLEVGRFVSYLHAPGSLVSYLQVDYGPLNS
jgi:hypothetical protein